MWPTKRCMGCRQLQAGWVGVLLLLLLVPVVAIGLWWFAPASALTHTPPWRVTLAEPLPRAPAYLSIPYIIPVAKVEQSVRDAISGELFAAQIKVPGRKLSIDVQRNGPLVLWVKNAKLRMELPIAFETQGDLEVEGELTIATNARFDIDPNWQPNLHVKTTFWWNDEPSVGFWPFLFDIGEDLQPFIQAALDAQSTKLMEKARSAYKLREMAQVGWRQLQVPLPLGNDKNRWLLMRPQQAWVEPVSSDDDYIYVNFWIGATPVVVAGDKPAAQQLVPLPDLHKGEPPAKKLVLDYPVSLGYAQASAMLTQALQAKRLQFEQGWLSVRHLRLYPAGREVALELEYRAQKHGQWFPAHGRVTLLGKLQYDPSTQQMSLTDVHLAQPQPQWWQWRQQWVLQAPLAERIAKLLSWPMQDKVVAAAGQMNAQLAGVVGKNFQLWGGITTTVPTRPRLTEQGMSLSLRSVGDMSLMITP